MADSFVHRVYLPVETRRARHRIRGFGWVEIRARMHDNRVVYCSEESSLETGCLGHYLFYLRSELI